jgi:hypothetical protein
MRRIVATTLVALATLCLVAVSPVVAASRQAITIDAATTFDDLPDTFTATGLDDCSSGIVENGDFHVAFTRHHGVFVGDKVFTCDGDGTGFVLRLNAMFGESGSVGAWSVLSAWGSLAGMHGAGGLIGDPIEGGGILDQYAGNVTFE